MKKVLLIVVLAFFSGSVFAKCTSGDCVNGFGMYISENFEYVGEHKNGKAHGLGAFIFANEDQYVGELKNDKMNGQGTYMFINGEKYQGGFLNGNRHGQGTYTYADGYTDIGIWKNGKLIERNKIIVKSNFYKIIEFLEAQDLIENTENEKNVVSNENQENNISQTNEKKSQEQTTKVVNVKKNNLDKKSLKEELQYWKELFEDELITKAEYDQKRKELLEGGVQETQVTNNETKIVKPKNTNNIKTVTVDMKYKNKNYLNNSLLNQKKWSKISNYCDAKYNTFWEYQECEAQNTKAYKMYNKAKNIYDIYISYGELLSYQALAGEISQQQARYYYESKRNELEDAYNKNKSAKWNNFVNNMLKIQQYSNSLNNNTKPPSFNSHRTCTISSWRGGTVADISCH